jgi:hypothetical protein
MGFEPKRYFMMLFGLMAAMLFLSHCMFLPLLAPFFHCASWLTHALSLIISFSLSLALTETFQEKYNNGLFKVLFYNSDEPVDFGSTEQNRLSSDELHLKNKDILYYSEFLKNDASGCHSPPSSATIIRPNSPTLKNN